MMELTVVITIVASLISVLLREALDWYNARLKLQIAAEREFKEALASDSLKSVGDYLDRAVGQFSVKEYAHNPDVRRRVNTFLARVEDFVGKSEEIKNGIPVRMPPDAQSRSDVPDPELEIIEQRLLSGAIWDGLAHLRRVIEQRLRFIAAERGLKVPDKPGATRLIALLDRHEFGNTQLWERLRYVVGVCNRGVHGLPVSTAESLEVLESARRALHVLGLTQTPGN